MKALSFGEIPLFIPRSSMSTAVNKTGSWRFFHPKYEEKTAPCSAACPVGLDIPRIEMLTSWGLLKTAWQTILAENPFPAVCGRVCFHPCERACSRTSLDEPIAVHAIERFLGDTAISKGRNPQFELKSANGKRVAVAGAGPAGLAAAYFLSRLGYACEVFEARSEPGGLLRWGIPGYRLPHDILKDEINRIEKLGVTILCDTPVTPRILPRISNEYDALFIGCGNARSIRLKIAGAELAYDGLKFLDDIRRGKQMSFEGAAAIVGGGNTAVDLARSLVRLGVSPLIVYRRRIADMPAFMPEMEMAIREGVTIMELVAPIRIEENRLNPSFSQPDYILTLQKMKISKEEINGRARVIPEGQKTQTINVDRIFTAIGAEAEAFWQFPLAGDTNSLNLSHCKLIDQNLPIVLGGDLTSPLKSVTDAIASGKQAAMALDAYFENGLTMVEKRLAPCRVGPGPSLSMDAYLGGKRLSRSTHVVTYDEINIDYFPPAIRVTPSSLGQNQRIKSFAEIESTLSNSAAKEEAKRCFNCGVCNACDFCRLFCPEMAVIIEKTERRINMDYCKGCGVCVTECPRNAMALEEEIK